MTLPLKGLLPAVVAAKAELFASQQQLVHYKGNIYQPKHFLTGEENPPSPETTVWVPLTDEYLEWHANNTFHMLIRTDGEHRMYRRMLRQFSIRQFDEVPDILVNINNDHVEALDHTGKLKPVTGKFIPNYMNVPYHTNNPLIEECYATIVEWCGSEDQAKSLLHHLATALQPTWSAGRYVLLIGDGRNGKGTLLKMIKKLFGPANISGISRLDMASRSSVIHMLNGKLLNIYMDGPKDFLKDSSTEKTLIVGEDIMIEMKFENVPLQVQTNALFIEGLNDEPNTSDKSPALQARLVRFRFDQHYAYDIPFGEKMVAPEMLAALLHLLLEHWVNKHEVSEKLMVTAESLDLQMEAVREQSPVLQFMETLSNEDLQNILEQRMRTEYFERLLKKWMEEHGYTDLKDSYLRRLITERFKINRKVMRFTENGEKFNSSRSYLEQPLPDTLNVINELLSGERTPSILDVTEE